MRILFQNEQLAYRGTTNSTVDYAHFNQEILGNESVIIYNTVNPYGVDVDTKQDVVEMIKKRFEVLTYSSTEELNRIASKFDFVYSQRSGMLPEAKAIIQGKEYKASELKDSQGNLQVNMANENAIVTSTKFGVHCVFQWYYPHGDVHAYISEWLAQEVAYNNKLTVQPEFVPLIVDLPEPNANLRKWLGISDEQFVFGRHGGYETFDIDFVKRTILKIVCERKDFVFLFANTKQFIDHPNVIFLKPFFDKQMTANFVNSCDAMIHARGLGETFGLAISEFLFQNKPVLAWEGGFDRNHVHMLNRFGTIYNEKNLYDKLVNIRHLPNRDFKGVVEPSNPKNAMAKFQKVFLKGA